MFCQNLWYIRKTLCQNLCYTRKFDVFSPKWCHIQQCYISNPCYPWKYVFCPNICHIQKCAMSEHMVHTNTRCILSELMLHAEMYYVQTYVTHENMISCVRTNDTFVNVLIWTYVPHCRIWDLFYLNNCYSRKCAMSEHILHTNMKYFLSELTLHTKV